MRCKDSCDDQGHSRAVSSCATPGLLNEDAGGMHRNKVHTMGCRGLLGRFEERRVLQGSQILPTQATVRAGKEKRHGDSYR